MASSASFDATFGGHPFTLRLNLSVTSQSIALNQSYISWNLQIIKTGNFTPYRTDGAATWAFNWAGSGNFGPYNFNGAVGQTITIASGSFTVNHNSDGTGSAATSFSANALSTITTASGSGTLVLDTIPRGTQPTVSPTSGETGSTFTIGHTPASSAFYHDVAYSLDGGTTYTDIVTNLVGTDVSTDWTPAHTLLPNSSSVTAIIRVKTYSSSGGTLIGTKTVNLPLTVPASVKPVVSSVAWVDDQTSGPDMPTLMGGAGRFVQRWSKLKPTVTAAGAGGSTVTGSTVTQNGQVTPSGTAFGLPVALSGAVPYSVVATDSRTRTSDTYNNTVAVTAYNFPNLPTPTVVRTSDAGGTLPSPTGTYLKVTPSASVSSLIFGGSEKNLLEWQIRTRPAGGSWTTVQAWTAATVSGNTWTTPKMLSGYLSSAAYEVEVSIRDLFGKNGYDSTHTVVALTIPVASELVFMDWNGADQIGLWQYAQYDGLNVGKQIYQIGLPVVDFGDTASTSTPGIQRNATNAEAVTGTATDRTITPSTMKYALDALGTPQPGRNRLHNGAFRINQRNCVSGGWLTGTNQYTFDRWKFFGAYNLASNPVGVIPGTGNTTVGWGGFGGAYSVLTGLTIPGLSGVTTAVRGTALAGDTGGMSLNGSIGRTIPVVAGGAYRFSMWVRSSVAKTVVPAIQWANASTSSGNTLGTGVALAANVWTRIDVQGTAPAGATYGGPYAYQSSGVWAAGNTMDVTGVLVENTTSLNAYYAPPTLTFTATPQGQAVTTSGAFLAQVVERANMEAGTYTISGFTGFVTVFNEGSTAPAFQSSPATFTVDGTQNVYVLFSAGSVLDGVQMEKGTVATPFERISVGQELATCQRYYWRFTASVQAALFSIGWFTTTAAYGVLQLPEIMRAVPTFAISGQTGATLAAIVNGSSTTVSAIAFAQLSERSARVALTTSSAPVNAAGWTEITTNSWVEASADL